MKSWSISFISARTSGKLVDKLSGLHLSAQKALRWLPGCRLALGGSEGCSEAETPKKRISAAGLGHLFGRLLTLGGRLLGTC